MVPKLDRVVHFDEKSRGFSIRTILDKKPVLRKRRVWTTRINGPLDQGNEGRCVIFGWGGELAATPHRYQIDDAWCNQKWPLVWSEDQKMGNNYPEGASVLAGAKAMILEGAITKYLWAFGIDDVIDTLVSKGPVILGINWYHSMYSTNSWGLVDVSGDIVGGHCIMANGYWPNHPSFEEDVIIWTNSWGINYGLNGRGYIKVSDLDRLLKEDGEAVIPTDKPIVKEKGTK